MERFNDIKLGIDHDETELRSVIAKKMGCNISQLKYFSIVRKSVDARNKKDIKFVYSVDASLNYEYFTPIEYPKLHFDKRPVVIGFGPAGMFCALTLARCGLKPIALEKGSRADIRKARIENFWLNGELDENTNVQCGEGGAGTFSDGKLTTLVNSPYSARVLRTFVDAGAPEEILYVNKPHIGTDNLIRIVQNIRNEIISLGGEVVFDSPVDDFIIENNRLREVVCGNKRYDSDCFILCAGHSASDVFETLYAKKVAMKQKIFSVGVRIEHPQILLNESQYGRYANDIRLPSADYKLVYHGNNGKSAYTFCMCPGGYVVASSSKKNTVVTNGMSYFKRDGQNANSAILVNVGADDFGGGVLDGLHFQTSLEKRAYELGGGGYVAPFETVGDFLGSAKRPSTYGDIAPTYRPGVFPASLDKLFTQSISEALKAGIKDMSKRVGVFSRYDAPLTAVESRSSSPITILRNEAFESISTENLYPCGEGCGHSGGIMTSAIDGIRVAEAIMKRIRA